MGHIARSAVMICVSLVAWPQAAIAEGPVVLKEIVVTATKRAVAVQDVPASITAIGSSEIAGRGLVGMGDYISAVPSASLVEVSSVSNGIVIRGIDTGPVDQNFGAGTTVATYFGETPLTNSAGLLGGSSVDMKLVDIERIEVLRGPQGTAFGNSSLGGAVRTIPVAPDPADFSGQVRANLSQTSGSGGDNYMAQGVLNLPLVQDRLAIRAVGYTFDNSGIYNNVAGSDATLQAYAASVGPQAVSLAHDIEDRGSNHTDGGRVSLLFQATEDLRLSVSYADQKIEQDGSNFTTGRGGPYSYRAFSILESRGLRGSTDYIFDNHIKITNAMLEYDFSWANLVASTSWVNSGTQQATGASLFAPYDFVMHSPHDSVASEIRLVSSLEGPVQFLAGLYHEDLDDISNEVYSSLETPALELQNTGYGDGVNEVLGVFYNERDLQQDAVFGEVSYDFTDKLSATVGARFYEFDRQNRLETSGWFASTPLSTPDITLTDVKQSGDSYKASLSYEPTENSLYYLSWSQGFRLGRPAGGLIPAICDTDGDGLVDGTNITIASTREIDSDSLDNYELGGKYTLMDGRMTFNTSVFHIDWSGLPTNASALCGGTPYFYVANAGEATSQGVEMETSFYVTPAFRIDLRGSYTNAELSKDAPDLGAEEGDRLPGSPEWIGYLALQYDFEIADHPTFVRADASYRGTFYGNLAQDPLTKSGGYTVVDARAGMKFGGVSVELFVDNLTDDNEFVFRGLDNFNDGFGFKLRPRTIGLEVGYNF